jgi:uncharacterized protein (DUF427 family)
MGRLPNWAERGRTGWSNTGTVPPAFAESPGPGQESVWDYPRPPRIVDDRRFVEVKVGDLLVARTNHAVRVLETASPPTFYLPPDSVEPGVLERAPGASKCEWKGTAAYWDVVAAGERLAAVAWSYPAPFSEFEALRDYVSFYPARIECIVGAERVAPQPGRFYGGWVTSEVVGPFKGQLGSENW